ncbi:ABC transporter permease subunit [Holospora curviuscula]|uniref:Inner membrane ABC transporter permease protein YejB n=1 Tax=Holospora curviuscula TaxID=1082868 RepID=A0A2S5RI22_9PROT|nr:ABC transporter permease subunit [Holospora curviuscula]PPE06966.1 Inner membrane ABC transporter permease protein YejB [Holospora curviuscula]
MSYILKRFLLIIPTLFSIILLNFLILHLVPGGPVEQMLHRIEHAAQERGGSVSTALDLEQDTVIKELNRQFGLDQPLWKRFYTMIKQYLSFDFGKSYFRGDYVTTLLLKSLPVSLSLGLWSMVFMYGVAIPLGIQKAVRNGSYFDFWTSIFMILSYAIPTFLFALLLMIFFAGGSFFSYFPIQGLFSWDWGTLSLWGKIKDYVWHLVLPVSAQVLTGFAVLTLLTKNAFLEELSKQYVVAAHAFGFKPRTILFKHIFRNAMIVMMAHLPLTLFHVLFSGSFLLEMIFSLEGIGLLSYEAIGNRDYPIIFGSLYLFTLIGLVLHVISDLLYTWIDPRIHFEGNKTS